MKDVLLSFFVGSSVGILFSLIKLPIPAPPTLSGIFGIIGMFVGYILVSYFK